MASALCLARYVSSHLRFPFFLGLVILFIFRDLLSSLEFSLFLLQALSISALATLEYIQDLDLEWFQ
jgi:hypothetical protein